MTTIERGSDIGPPVAVEPVGPARPAREDVTRTRARISFGWERLSFAGLIGGTALLYLVGLSKSGWANQFYAAAVQSGSKSWTAMLFGSLDAGNFITVDKPPLALWPMGLSVRIFGLSSWSILVPQALEGVAGILDHRPLDELGCDDPELGQQHRDRREPGGDVQSLGDPVEPRRP